jgi:TRAP-type uncharacterized transport system substrate-binding protein
MRLMKWAGALCAGVLVLFVGGSALADAPTGPELTAQASAQPISVISGGLSGTSLRIADDLANVLDADSGLRVLPVVGKGSLQDIADLLYLPGVDVGIVQTDVLAYAKAHRLYPGIDKSIQYICKLFDEEVHVLAAPKIRTLRDLAGQKVNVGPAGGDADMTASMIFNELGIAPEYVHDDQAEALRKLREGEIAAIVDVDAKPARALAQIPAETGLHFIAVPLTPALLNTYLPAELDHADYPALVADNAPVDTVAVGTVMAVYAWPPGSARYAKLATFVAAMFGNFQRLLHPPYLPQWRDVNLAAELPGWTRFPPAQDWLARRVTAEAGTGITRPSESEFEAFLAHLREKPSAPSDEQKSTLFQHFLDWRAEQQRVPQ